jgi:hypothetical protein
VSEECRCDTCSEWPVAKHSILSTMRPMKVSGITEEFALLRCQSKNGMEKASAAIGDFGAGGTRESVDCWARRRQLCRIIAYALLTCDYFVKT